MLVLKNKLFFQNILLLHVNLPILPILKLKSFFTRIIIFLFYIFFYNSIVAQDFVKLPNINSYVYDSTNTLNTTQKHSIEQQLKNFESQYGSQVLVVIIPSTKPETIEEFTIRLAEKVKPGRKNIDDGIILLIAKNDKKVRIEVGYGLEGDLPDIIAKNIIDNYIIPLFRQGNFSQGILLGVSSILQKITTGNLPKPVKNSNIRSRNINTLNIHPEDRNKFLLFFVLLVLLFVILNRLLGKKIASIFSFLSSGVLGKLLFGSFLVGFGIVIAIGVFILFLLLSSLTSVGRGYYPYGRGGMGGGMGRGGGGFSGGGGSFGGGGASGGW